MCEIKYKFYAEEGFMSKPYTLAELLDIVVFDHDIESENGDFISAVDLRLGLKYGTIVALQYTGLKDKNGVEIFEGDVIRVANIKEEWKYGEPDFDWRIFEVQYNRYTWAINNKAIYRPLSDYDNNDGTPYDIEIIGNIYENPELLADSNQQVSKVDEILTDGVRDYSVENDYDADGAE
jgi:uncharacterized phage protein (TIGR01671 family)